MTDPRPHSRGGKNPGFWIQTEARGDCLALVLTLHLSLLEPPPRHHFHLITSPPSPLPPSHPSPCLLPVLLPPFVPQPQVWMGPLELKGSGSGEDLEMWVREESGWGGCVRSLLLLPLMPKSIH